MTSGGGEPQPIKPGMLALGILLGAVASYVWLAIVILMGGAVAYGVASDGGSGTASTAAVVVAVLVGAAPIVATVVLAARPRTRQLGAGLVIGLAIGMIAGAGICGLGFLGSGG